jgi:Cu(I)/Ag(I) efflux system membrane fusion protein
MRAEAELAGADDRTRRSAAETTLASRDKLALLGLTGEQITRLEERGETSDHVTIYSPIGGVVIHKNAIEGEYVKTGTPIYTIADLSRVWVKLDAYESDLPWVKYGQEVAFETDAYPGDVFKGRITFVDPILDPKTRTVKVRVNLPNEEGRLKPGMFVRATLRASLSEDGRVYDKNLAGKWISPMHPEVVKEGPGSCDVCGMDLVPAESLGFLDLESSAAVAPLVLPASAPLITGKRAVVYVADPNNEGSFTGREVVLGPRAGDWYLVREGLVEGERVVVAGNFKIDSALQIMAGPSMMNPVGGGPALNEAVPEAFSQQLSPLFGAYLEVQAGLSGDDPGRAQAGSNALLSDLENVDMSLLGHEAHKVWLKDLESLRESASGIAGSKRIEKAREHFEDLSFAITRVAETFGTGMGAPLYVYHCSMAFDFKGADWLQSKEGTENPYFGASMFKCGSKQRELPSAPLAMMGDAHE